MSDTAPAASTETQDFTEYQERYIGSREHDSLDALGELVGEVEGSDPADGERSSPEPEGTEPEPKTSETAAAQPETPVEGADEPNVEELLKTAVALDYTVNGEAKTFDGISVIPGQGAIVTEAALPALRDRLQQAESARADARQLFQKLSEYESMSFKAGDQEYKGRQAFERLHVENARLNAFAGEVAKVLENPARLADLIIYDPAKGEFTLNPASLQLLQRELSLSVRDSEWRARDGLTARQTASQQQTNVAEQRSTAIAGAVQHWATQFPELTADDITKANAHFARIGSAVVRPATEEEARSAGVKVGDLVIDHPLIHEFLSDRAALRKGAVTAAASAATTATAANKENTSRLAAATVKKPGAKRTATAASAPPRSRSEEWEEQKARLQSGRWSADNE